MSKLSGAVAIVTGASRGIGFAIAQRFIAEGAKVCITGRDAQALETAVKDLGGSDVAIGVAGKGDDPEHRAAVVDTVRDTFGPVSLLVNNIGINPAYGPLGTLDLGAARKMLDVNVLGTLGWVQEALRGGLAEAGGSIVNISSISAHRPAPTIAAYAAAKAGLDSLTTSLAMEWSPRVRVNAVDVGLCRTEQTDDHYGDDASVATIERTIPLGRMARPEEVGNVVAFLASDLASYVSGATVACHGGGETPAFLLVQRGLS